MHNLLSVLAWVIASVTFCLAIAFATFDYSIPYGNFINYLSSISNIGIFVTSLIAVFYAVKQYEDYKELERTNLLCNYNQRYSSDKNIEEVITWMLKISILNQNGDIIGAEPNRVDDSPGIYKKEMFMRFYEELYLYVRENKIDKRESCRLFSYYALKFDEIKEFRLDITDYISVEEEKKTQMNKDIMKQINYWDNYRNYIKEMAPEWERIKKGI